jgi:hypothetical protein
MSFIDLNCPKMRDFVTRDKVIMYAINKHREFL